MESRDKSLEVASLMKEVTVLMKHHMNKAFEEKGLTVPQGFLLGTLSKNGKMKVHELSQKLSMNDSTVSGIIDRLEKQGMVDRVRSLEDKRVVYVSISPEYERSHGDLHQIMGFNIGNIMKQGTDEELDEIIAGFNTLKKLLNKAKNQ